MNSNIAKLAACVLAGLSLHANAAANNSNSIETISITGSRLPIAKPFVAGSASIIDAAQIEASGALNLGELLRGVAGVNLSQTGPLGSLMELRFRGSESNHVMVLVDGVEINDLGQGGLVDFSHIMLSQVERVEILRGPQSAIWGSNAIAGIISIVTRQPDSEQMRPNLQLTIGDRDTLQTSAGVSQAQDKLSYAINAGLFKTGGENISRSGREQDGYKNTSLSTKLLYQIRAKHSVQLNARLLDYSSDFDATDFSSGLIADADNTSLGEQISLGLNWRFAPLVDKSQATLSLTSMYSQLLSLQYSKQSNTNYSDNIFSGGTQGEKLRILWTNHFEFSRNTFINLGIEAVQEDYKQSGPVTFGDPNQTQNNNTYSLVSSGQWALNDAFNLEASLRYDNSDEFKNTESYRLGGVYRFSANWRAFLSTGKAIKNPTFTERFGFFPDTFLGNPELAPETQKSYEAGIEGKLMLKQYAFNVQLSIFDADLNNEILGFVFSPQSGQFTAQNSDGKSKRSGLELSLNGERDAFSWQAQYSYLDAEELDSNRQIETELRRARHTGSASFSYQFDDKNALYMQADYTGGRLDRFFPPFPESPEIVGLNAYWLLSANYRYEVSQTLIINLRLSNMLNRQYEDVVGFSGESSRALLSMRYSW